MGDVVLLSAGLMAKVPALGIVCAEEMQRLAAGKFVFKRLDPFRRRRRGVAPDAVQCLQVSTAVARPSTGSPFAAGGVAVVEGQGDACALPWSSTEAHWFLRLLSSAPLEDHSPRQACLFVQDTMCFLLGQDTFVKTQCCGSHLAAPLLTDFVGQQWG